MTEGRGARLSPTKLGKALSLSQADMAKLLRLHRNTLLRKPHSDLVQSRAGEVATILTAAAELVGDMPRAVLWFCVQPLAGFSGRTARELVAAGKGEAVRRHLEMLRDGLHA